jgi:hypothetical protein
MWRHISSKVKAKYKQVEDPSSTSEAQSDTLAHLNSLLCFYLIYVMFLFAGHNSLSATTGATSWGVARLVELDSHVVDGRRDWATGSRGGGSHGIGHPLGAWGPRGASQGVVGVVVWGWWWGRCLEGGRPETAIANQLLVIWILILFRFIFVWSNKFIFCRLWRSLLAPNARTLEDRTVIHPVGERQWEDINWNGQGHRSCANMELETFCQLLYPDMVHVGDRWEVAHLWTQWALRQYVDKEPMRSCTLVDPVGAQAVRRQGLLRKCREENVLSKFSR